jgi:ABC-type sugar transport system ATPase subunit
MAGIRISGLSKTYAGQTGAVVENLDLDIQDNQFVTLLGPSGCGKTTTLRMVAGLESVTSGRIRIGDREVQHLAPGKRDIGVGFESYALYPPLDVRENLGYGLKARGVKDAAARVRDLAHRLEMDDLLDLRPASLSSGQKQRVALARALIRNPRVLLLDEPLSHLDAAQRQRVRRELKVLQREFGYTTIVVTHDQLEALSLADRMAVMNAGVIEQFGTPDEIYDDPANVFVADFVGEPKINLFEGTAVKRGTGTLVKVGRDSQLEVDAPGARDGQAVTVGLRPQDTRPAHDDEPGVACEVVVYEDFMEFGLATLEVPGVDGRLVAQLPHGLRWRRGENRRIAARPDRVYLFDTDTGGRIR